MARCFSRLLWPGLLGNNISENNGISWQYLPPRVSSAKFNAVSGRGAAW